MMSEVLSVRIRSDIKRRMREFKEVDWKREIESFLERRLAELELERVLRGIEEALNGVAPAGEPAWRSVRTLREEV